MTQGNTVQWEPTTEDFELLEELGGLGLSKRSIAARFGYSESQFTQYIKTNPDISLALEKGKSLRSEQVARALHTAAIGDNRAPANVQAIIWWEKTREGMAETTRHELSGPEGGPIVEKIVPDARFISDVIAEIEKANQLRYADGDEG